jgi:hypothetical protein
MLVVFSVTGSALSFLLGFDESSDFEITEGSFHWKVCVEILDFSIGFSCSQSLLIYFLKKIFLLFSKLTFLNIFFILMDLKDSNSFYLNL